MRCRLRMQAGAPPAAERPGTESVVCNWLEKDIYFLVLPSFGYIAQWLERLTADQQVPGSNPGVPSFAGVTGTGGELARAGVAPSRLSHRVWMTPLCLRGLMDKVPSSLIFEARLRRESRIQGRCGFKSCHGYSLTMFHARCAAECGLTFDVRRAGRGAPTPSTTTATAAAAAAAAARASAPSVSASMVSSRVPPQPPSLPGCPVGPRRGPASGQAPPSSASRACAKRGGVRGGRGEDVGKGGRR